MRSSFLGAFLGSLLERVITRVTRKTAGPILLALALLVAWVVQWFAAQETWVQVMIVLAVALLLIRPWRRGPLQARRVEPSSPQRLEDQPHFLYRWFSEDGELLYVGISNDLARRTGQHIADKPWMVPGVRCEAESYPNRASVLEAEEQAIYSENPLHNKVHNRGPLW